MYYENISSHEILINNINLMTHIHYHTIKKKIIAYVNDGLCHCHIESSHI